MTPMLHQHDYDVISFLSRFKFMCNPKTSITRIKEPREDYYLKPLTLNLKSWRATDKPACTYFHHYDWVDRTRNQMLGRSSIS